MAAAVGLLSGLVCVALRRFLTGLQILFTGHAGPVAEAAAHLARDHRLLTPALGGLCAAAILWAGKRWAGDRKPVEYEEAIRSAEHGHPAPIPLREAIVRMLSSSFSVATGASIGREGSMIQFAAATSSQVLDLWQRRRGSLTPQRQSLALACAVSAAVGAVYGAPLAGVFFACEIGMGQILWASAPPLLLSGILGAASRHYFLEAGPLFPIATPIHLHLRDLFPALLLASAAGLLAPAYYHLLQSAKILRRIPLAMVLAGLLVGALSLAHPDTWGNGETALVAMAHAQWTPTLIATVLALRLLATSACVGAGAVGGVFTPTTFAGAALGSLWAFALQAALPQIFPGPLPMFFVVLGIACFLAAVTHAPIMSALMAAELTGTLALVPALLAAAFLAREISRRILPASIYGAASSAPLKPHPPAAAIPQPANPPNHSHQPAQPLP
jgi:CIC family chloride channel protein